MKKILFIIITGIYVSAFADENIHNEANGNDHPLRILNNSEQTIKVNDINLDCMYSGGEIEIKPKETKTFTPYEKSGLFTGCSTSNKYADIRVGNADYIHLKGILNTWGGPNGAEWTIPGHRYQQTFRGLKLKYYGNSIFVLDTD